MQRISLSAVLLALISGFFLHASAERFTGGSYTIDASVAGNSFGGDTTGGSYTLTSSGGESVIGQGSGGSYKLGSGYVAQLENSLQLTLQPGNLGVYYDFSEPSGTFVRDLSVNSYNSSISGAVSRSTGKIGNGLDFDGSSTSIPVANNATIQSTSGTVSAWSKTTTTTATMGIFVKPQAFYLGINFNRIATFDWNANSTCQASTSGNIANGSWHHVVLTYASGVTNGTKLYLDNTLMATCTMTIMSSSSNAHIGSSNNGTSDYQFFNGSLDEVKYFSRILSPNEIEAEYQAGNAGNTAGLAFATSITPGISQTSNYDAAVLTDASNGYTLSVSQNQNLTKGSDTIAAVSGSIASPVSWVEGTTKGLGFTLYGTNATAIPGKWSSGSAYAAFPGSGTSFYVRNGKPSSKDIINMRLRLDVPTTQVSGTYTNVLTTTGTITP